MRPKDSVFRTTTSPLSNLTVGEVLLIVEVLLALLLLVIALALIVINPNETSPA